MGSMGLNHSLSRPQLSSSTAPRQGLTRSQSSPELTTNKPLTQLQQQVYPSRVQAQFPSLSSESTLQKLHTQIESRSAHSLNHAARQCLLALGEHPLTQGLLTHLEKGIETGTRLYHVNEGLEALEITLPNGEKVKPSEKLEEVMEALTQKFEWGETNIPTAEAEIFETLTGVSTESMGSLKEIIASGQQLLYLAKTAQCLRTAYTNYGTANFGEAVETLAKVSYQALGGKSSIELAEKVSAFCQKCDLDSGKELMTALAKFSTDENIIASAERSLLSWATVGVTAGGYLGQAVPFLSYGAAALDASLAAKNSYHWWQGQASGTELLKSSVTALGSISGATVAPVVGPLAATAINFSIDTVSSSYTAISNWWSGR